MRDIFKATSVDYDATEEAAKTFFATIQNKLVFAVTGRTAAELVVARADPAKPNMALTSWKGDRVRKGDITVSKNYLDGKEIASLSEADLRYFTPETFEQVGLIIDRLLSLTPKDLT